MYLVVGTVATTILIYLTSLYRLMKVTKFKTCQTNFEVKKDEPVGKPIMKKFNNLKNSQSGASFIDLCCKYVFFRTQYIMKI